MKSVNPDLIDQWKLPDSQNTDTAAKTRKHVIIICAVIALLLAIGVGWVVGNKTKTSDSAVPAVVTSAQGSSAVSQSNNFNPQQSATPEPATVTVVQTEVVIQQQPAQVDQQSLLGTSIQCDGRGVLIVSSIIDTGQDIATEASNVIAKYPGAKMLKPGACSSLRASTDGNDVYAIVLDYGFDTSALCAAEARLGGNPRTMNNSGNFASPCE